MSASPLRTARAIELPAAPVLSANEIEDRVDRSSSGVNDPEPNHAPDPSAVISSALAPSVTPFVVSATDPGLFRQLAAAQPFNPFSQDSSTTGAPGTGLTVTVKAAVDVSLPLLTEYGTLNVPNFPVGTNFTVPSEAIVATPPGVTKDI